LTNKRKAANSKLFNSNTLTVK